MKTVTLDALIPREDFDILSEIGGNNNTRNKATLSIEDLIGFLRFLARMKIVFD